MLNALMPKSLYIPSNLGYTEIMDIERVILPARGRGIQVKTEREYRGGLTDWRLFIDQQRTVNVNEGRRVITNNYTVINCKH